MRKGDVVLIVVDEFVRVRVNLAESHCILEVIEIFTDADKYKIPRQTTRTSRASPAAPHIIITTTTTAQACNFPLSNILSPVSITTNK